MTSHLNQLMREVPVRPLHHAITVRKNCEQEQVDWHKQQHEDYCCRGAQKVTLDLGLNQLPTHKDHAQGED